MKIVNPIKQLAALGLLLAGGALSVHARSTWTNVDAIYENSKIVLPRLLSLPEHAQVRVTIESSDTEREAWLKLSEDSLTKVWDNAADDVYNDLLKK